MTTTDRAFIAAFRRETKPPVAQAKVVAPPSAQGLPGAGVEVVSFAVSERTRQLNDPPEARRRESTVNERSAGLVASLPRHILHGPHPGVLAERSGRRPLSSFTREREEREVGEEFRPAIILPRLRWPPLCTQLGAEHSDRLTKVLEAVGHFPVSGTKILGIVGTEQGAGCTTLTLALARQAARLGRRVVVLEASADAPGFRCQLGLAAEQGLSELLTAKVELQDVTTYAHDDRVAVVPWGQASATAIDGRRRLQLSLAAGRLRFAFDLVLVDLGAPTPACRVALDVFAALHGDATLVVVPAACPTRQLDELQAELESTGRPVLGVIENGVPASQLP